MPASRGYFTEAIYIRALGKPDGGNEVLEERVCSHDKSDKKKLRNGVLSCPAELKLHACSS
jgi:hypothetical protein